MRAILIATACLSALAIGGCQYNAAPDGGSTAVSASENGQWKKFVTDYIEADFKSHPGFAVAQGRHEYDGQVSDLSADAIAADVARLKKAIADAEAFGDDTLTKEQQFERDYLVAVTKGNLFWIDPDGADQLRKNPASYLGWEIAKGLAFVTVTSLLLYALLRRLFGSVAREVARQEQTERALRASLDALARAVRSAFR